MKIRSEQGASAVEFALVLPLLLLLTFGIIEFGILLFDKAVVTNASREGARFGILYAKDADGNHDPKDNNDIRKRVTDYANGYLINLGGDKNTLEPADIAIDPSDPKERTSESTLTVTVTFRYNFLVFPDLSQLVGGTFGDDLPLVGKTVMRME